MYASSKRHTLYFCSAFTKSDKFETKRIFYFPKIFCSAPRGRWKSHHLFILTKAHLPQFKVCTKLKIHWEKFLAWISFEMLSWLLAQLARTTSNSITEEFPNQLKHFHFEPYRTNRVQIFHAVKIILWLKSHPTHSKTRQPNLLRPTLKQSYPQA